MLLSFVSLFLWYELWLWAKRFIFYVLLGPWNKVVDVFYIRKLERMTEQERKERKNQRQKLSRNRFSSVNIKKQQEKEELLKSAAMKEHMFGKHLLSVPNLMQPERFPSEPRPESSAIPDRNQLEKSFKKAEQRVYIAGQR